MTQEKPSRGQMAAAALQASRRSSVAPFIVMDVMTAAAAREAAGHHVVHLEIGEPGAPTPLRVRDAVSAAMAGGRIGYTLALGRPSLRARIARHYSEAYGVEVAADNVIATAGSSGGFILAFLALFDAGARVAIATPGYPPYQNIMQALGIDAVSLPTGPADRHAVTAAMIEAAHLRQPLDGVLLMSPANPSGTMLEDAALADICATCDRLGIAFISDEIYHGLTYDRPAQTALAFSRRAIVVNSFSKYYCMTGWRIGWMVVPDELVRPIERLQQNLSISVPTLGQIGAEAAFEAKEELELVRAGYARNRAVLLDALPAMGFDDFHPVDGAFYVYMDVGRFTNDSVGFCKRMLEEAGVAATPGLDFDRERGNRTVRLSFAGAEADIVEAVRRLKRWKK